MNDPAVLQGRSSSYRLRSDHPTFLGRVSVLYLAEDVKSGDEVMIKAFREEIAEPGAIESFYAELDALHALRHPNILPILDHGGVRVRPAALLHRAASLSRRKPASKSRRSAVRSGCFGGPVAAPDRQGHRLCAWPRRDSRRHQARERSPFRGPANRIPRRLRDLAPFRGHGARGDHRRQPGGGGNVRVPQSRAAAVQQAVDQVRHLRIRASSPTSSSRAGFRSTSRRRLSSRCSRA